MTMFLDPIVGHPTGLATSALVEQHLVNHVVLVLDASGSMGRHRVAVRDQVKQLVSDLAEQSKVMKQETRLTIYSFDDEIRCLAFDTDVLRLSDVHQEYAVTGGMTALHDATAVGLDDLGTTSALYGDHAFLVYVITDGGENASRRYKNQVAPRMSNLPENWTVAAFVPDMAGVRSAAQMGFPADNVAMWNVNSATGFAEAGSVMRSATSSYMTARASGTRGTRTLFSTGSDAVNAQTVKANLTPLQRDSYVLQKVTEKAALKTFVLANGMTFVIGRHYYELTKTEHIQASKKIIVVNRASGDAYGGDQGRNIIGLPEGIEVKVTPDYNPEWAVFVQSQAAAGNRNLIPGQRLLTVLR